MHLKKIFLTALLLSIFVLNIQAQDTLKVYPNGSYFLSYFKDAKDIAIAPIKWDKKEWLIAGGVVGATLLANQYDKQIQNYFQNRQTVLGQNISAHGFEPWGSGLYTFPTLGLFYLQGAIFKNQDSKKVALLGVKAYVLSGIFVQIPKYLINRHRPYNDNPSIPNQFDGPNAPFYKSFPSGHTTSAFAVAAVIASEYRSTIWVPIVSYTLASFMGLSRIYDNKHWASDVLFGAAFGWAIGKLVYHSNHWKIKTIPVVSHDSASLHFSIQL
ncbi:MAG: phosphatase PAP2 family protein [Bacteroidales bacterium]|nr:phosphatase PAP2 family protein [Bacteroidales bacterium]